MFLLFVSSQGRRCTHRAQCTPASLMAQAVQCLCLITTPWPLCPRPREAPRSLLLAPPMWRPCSQLSSLSTPHLFSQTTKVSKLNNAPSWTCFYSFFYFRVHTELVPQLPDLELSAVLQPVLHLLRRPCELEVELDSQTQCRISYKSYNSRDKTQMILTTK